MTFLIIFHGIICVMLAIVILMQAGRKGGLTEAFASAESMLGTKTNSFMVTATTIFCVLFFLTSLGIAILSAQKGKSLMSGADVKSKSEQVDAPDQASKDMDAAAQAAGDAAVEAEGGAQNVVDEAAQDISADAVVVDAAVTQAAQDVVETVNEVAEDAAQAVETVEQPVVEGQ